jgi:rapamycin-insensitive companion of mTOR
MDTFFEIFRIKTPDWFNPFVSGKRLTLFRRPAVQEASSTSGSREGPSGMASRVNLVDHYLCLIMVVFVEIGLLEVRVAGYRTTR